MLQRDGFLARKLKCAICGRGLDHKRVGRIRKFCSDKCRDKARRDRDFVGAFGPSPTEVARTHESTKNSSTKSAVCEGAKRGRAFPVDLVGGGSFKWPGATAIDPELRRKIINAEFGNRLKDAGR
jgi:hypothetical protein